MTRFHARHRTGRPADAACLLSCNDAGAFRPRIAPALRVFYLALHGGYGLLWVSKSLIFPDPAWEEVILITDGFFARTRNPNDLGEILIYSSFSMLTQSWIPFAIQAFWIAAVFVPNMLKKERSMSRYPTWNAYVARTGLLFPMLFGGAAPETSTHPGA